MLCKGRGTDQVDNPRISIVFVVDGLPRAEISTSGLDEKCWLLLRLLASHMQ